MRDRATAHLVERDGDAVPLTPPESTPTIDSLSSSSTRVHSPTTAGATGGSSRSCAGFLRRPLLWCLSGRSVCRRGWVCCGRSLLRLRGGGRRIRRSPSPKRGAEVTDLAPFHGPATRHLGGRWRSGQAAPRRTCSAWSAIRSLTSDAASLFDATRRCCIARINQRTVASAFSAACAWSVQCLAFARSAIASERCR